MRDGGFQRGVGGSQPQTSPGQRPFSITEGSPPGMLVPVSHEGQVGGSNSVEAFAQGSGSSVGLLVPPPIHCPPDSPPIEWVPPRDQELDQAYSPWIPSGVDYFYVGSPRDQEVGSGGVNESGQESGLSFVSLTETPENQPQRETIRTQVSQSPQAQAVSAGHESARPIAIPMHPPPTFVHVPPSWGQVPCWQAHYPGAPIIGYPSLHGGFPVSFPMVSGIGVPPVDDVPKPPPYPPPESPRGTTESPGSLAALGVLRTPGGTPVPPMPPLSFADSIVRPERAKTGSGDIGVGVSRVPSLDRVEEPSRLVMNLPSLDVAPGSQDASVAAGDWVARVKPLLITLSPTAHKWWEETHARAYEFYQQWLVGQPSARLAVRAQVEAFRVDWGKLALVNERGAILILGALTPELQTECVTTRMLTAVSLLFTILVKYQPGGPSEKAAVLAFLSSPESPQGLIAAQSSLRRWLRLYNRTVELGLSKPDPTLLLRGLDRLGQQASKQSQASFRLSAYRFEQRLDYEPTDASVLAYAQVLLGEVEQQLLAETPEKKPRVAKAEVTPEASGESQPKAPNPPKANASGDPKGKGKKGKGGDSATSSSPGSAQDPPKPLCKGYLTAKGCAYGDNCRMQHDFASAGRQSLCYSCGSLDNRHRRQECPTLTRVRARVKASPKLPWCLPMMVIPQLFLCRVKRLQGVTLTKQSQ